MAVTTTIQVSFQSSESASMSAEIDTRPDGFNAGKTSFTFGDEPVILVRKTSNVDITDIKSTAGSVVPIGSGFTSEEEFLTFMQSSKANTSKAVSGGFQSTWYGANLGPVTLRGETEVAIAKPPTDLSGAVGVLGVSYQSQFFAYRLTKVPSKMNGKSNFNVLVLFVGAQREEQ